MVFGSDATRSRAEITEVLVRTYCGGLVDRIGGDERGWSPGARGFDSCDDAESCAERSDCGDAGAGAADSAACGKRW